ncbi:MAG: acetoin utilization protein AcuC [Candidatus Puniceispirillaceae bacterium]
MQNSVFLGSDIFRNSVYGNGHPLDIARVWPVIDICRFEGWLTEHNYKDIAPALPEVLACYHHPDYVDALLEAEETQSLSDDKKDRFNIGRSSNPIFPQIYKRPATAAQASLEATRYLASGDKQIVFNPSGGTHHGRKTEAFGFCFVNDPAIAIEALCTETDGTICYIDIDAHHCDGVQDWHYDKSQLRLFSIHQDNLWPRTGQAHDTGGGNALNIPVPQGAGDELLLSTCSQIILPKVKSFNPDFVIIQAGADGHKDDPQSKLAYQLTGYWQAVEMFLSLGKPTLILGGGGYNPFVTARAWAGIWAMISGYAPYKMGLSEASIHLLKSLSWSHRLGRNPPSYWYSALGETV